MDFSADDDVADADRICTSDKASGKHQIGKGSPQDRRSLQDHLAREPKQPPPPRAQPTPIMDDMERLWTLLAELSNQLSLNRQHCDALRRQAEDLKQQAVHVGTGFTLRRFNTDISKEVFESELERLNATLVLENHSLQHENKQLSMLLKDYEGTLENIMGRFRSFAHATQTHELSLVRHYEALLSAASAQRPASPASPVDRLPDLSRLSTLLVKTLRSMNGEDPSPPGTPIKGDIAEGGGYLALLGSLADGRDDALERDIEVEQLRRENEDLRHVLGIASDLPPLPDHTDPFIVHKDEPPSLSSSVADHTSPIIPFLPPTEPSHEELAPTVPPPPSASSEAPPIEGRGPFLIDLPSDEEPPASIEGESAIID